MGIVKFVRFGAQGAEKPGVLVDDDTVVDISSLVGDIGPETMSDLGGLVERVDAARDLPTHSVSSVRLGTPMARPRKMIAVGLNYADHAAESGMDVPTEPVIFMKATSSFSGPFDELLIPPGALKLDWEVELGIVIGENASYLADEAAALGVIAGYVVVHDVSERAYQIERGGQWVKGKSADTFSPTGPWLVTADEIADVNDLDLTLSVNGETRQTGNTSTMIFAVDHIVWYLSQFMTLEAGDLILTGTPPGVGMATNTYLKDGDVVELGVAGLGSQRQVCRQL